MLNKINNLITKLQQTNSQIDKYNILTKYSNDIEIIKFFEYCYSPYKLYGVSSKNLQKNSNLSELEFFKDIFELCDILHNRKATGKKALALVNGYINQNYQYEELLYNFFDRNLRIGMNIKQINKAFHNAIPTFEVALAATYDDNSKNKYNLTKYCIQRKCNGLRLISIIRWNNGNISIECLSRVGKEYTTMDKIKTNLKEAYENSLYKGYDIVIDGEVCIIDPNGKEDWNRAISEAMRKNHTINNPMYICFDILHLNEFQCKKQSMNYDIRYRNLKQFICGMNKKWEHLNYVFAVPYTDENVKKLTDTFVNTEKWEGLIFRKLAPFKAGRSNDLLKFKLFKDAEYVVKDVELTVKPMLNNNIMVDTPCVGALVIEHKGSRVAVGSGLSDDQRIKWFNSPNAIIGKTITVKYKEETKNQNGSIKLSFPTLLAVYENGRNF